MTTLTVAIAAEGPDGAIYRALIEAVLGRPVLAWNGTYVFTGCKAVPKLAYPFLNAAARAGVKHAMLAIDNDGSLRKRPEHIPTHAVPVFKIDDDDTCRECWLTGAIPNVWLAGDSKNCVAVPVQTIETWLLAIRGIPAFATATPEQQYSRSVLKKMFYGKPTPPEARRLEMAIEQLAIPGALTALSLRPSFQRFKAKIADW